MSAQIQTKRPLAILVLQGALVFALYLGTGWIGLQFNPVSGFATLIWPPTGIALAALVLFGVELWPAVFLAALAVNVITGASIPSGLGIAFGNTLEPLFAAAILRRAGFRPSMDRLQDAIAVVVAGGVIGPAIAATIGTSVLWASGIVRFETYLETWRAWWLGDAIGALLIAPLAFNWFGGGVPKPDARLARILEAVGLYAAVIGSGLIVFGSVLGIQSAESALVFLTFLPLLWAALRFGPRETISAVCLLSAIAIVGTVQGHGPFAREMLSEGLLYLQLFTGIALATAMLLASTAEELRRVGDELKKSNVGLRREAGRLGVEKKRSEALLSSIGEGVIVTDQDGRVVSMNRAAELLLGVLERDGRGRSLAVVAPLVDAQGRVIDEERRPFRLCLDSGQTVSTSIADDQYFVRKDGSRFPTTITASPVTPHEVVQGVVSVFRDASVDKETDQTRTEFVSIASHQLRNPLTSARWHLELLAGLGGPDPKQKEELKEVTAAVTRMAELVDDLLNVSRIERGTFTVTQGKVDLLEVVKKVLSDLKLQVAQKGIVLKERYGPKLPHVLTDPQLIRIALEDLVSNAIKYNSQGGSVRISVSRAKAGDDLEGRKAHFDGLLVTVADEGWGIPSYEQEKIFAKFFRAKNVVDRDVEGTGLGLYITKAIVDRSGGEIWFKSEEGAGTSFYILLPITP